MRAIAAAVVVALAAPSQAQEAAEPAEEAGDEAGQEGPEAGYGGNDPSEVKPAPSETGETPAAAPESYVVQPGDTLWNLSQRFLNNPWYWPKVWAYNPEFDNPNWIRPGSRVRFYAGGEAPAVVEEKVEDEPEMFEDVQGGGFEGDNVADRFGHLGEERRRREFFLPNERLEDAGQVLNSPEDKRMLSVADHTYVKTREQAKVGEVFQVFRAVRDVRHPVTGANLGKLVNLVGEVRVDALSREQSLGTVVQSWDPVERGDYVGRLPVEGNVVRAVANEKKVKGYVVETGPVPLSFFGETYVVIVDKGADDGVRVGNTFTIVRAGDPYLRQYSGLADEDIGEVLIIETEKSVATGVLLNSAREIVPGDRIEMRVGQ
jgi:hypothetical protein